MKPYKTIRLEEFPDVGDITSEGRKSSVGKLPGKSGEYRSYTRNPKIRKATRRSLKRSDKNRFDRQLQNDEE